MTAPLDRTSQIAGRSWTHPVPKFWIGIETHDSWHIPLEARASSPAPGGSTVQRDRRRGPSSWKAASESEPCRTGLGGVGIWCPFWSFSILFLPICILLYQEVSHVATWVKIVGRKQATHWWTPSFWIFNLILQCAFGIFPQTVWLHWGVLNVGCRLVVGYPSVSFFLHKSISCQLWGWSSFVRKFSQVQFFFRSFIHLYPPFFV